MSTFTFLLLGLSCCVSIAMAAKSKLIFAHVVFRHGDRAPGQPYPMDPHGPETWPQGLQELTTKGMMQHYRLGKYLRKRYSKLLNKQYLVKEIYIRASDKNRALQSAAADLAGLYPPIKNQVWNPKILWQPIPVHSVPTDDDYLLVVDNPCPRYTAVYQNQTKPIIDYYNRQYADFFSFLRNHTGLKNLDFKSIGDIYDPLYCEKSHGLKLPNWTQKVVNESTGQTVYELIVDLKNINKNLKYDTDEKALLTGGYLLEDILSRMKNVSTGNLTKELPSSKMVMYSAHDDTLMALLYSLNVIKRPFMVPYAATVFIDLFQNKQGQYYVELTYKTIRLAWRTAKENTAQNRTRVTHRMIILPKVRSHHRCSN